MKSENLLVKELIGMQKKRGRICISIIVPTHRLSPERRVDKLEVERAIIYVEQFLRSKYQASEIKPLLQALDELYKDIDFTHNSEGLGLYISSNMKTAVHFPFTVAEKIMVGDNFELRDLLYKVNYSNPYLVLLLTENKIRLFKGTWDKLNEIKDKNFPKEYHEEYIYNPPSQSTSYAGYAHVKGFEKDKSILEGIRFKDFFRHADDLMDDYLADGKPLILLGAEKELAWFESVSVHKKQIINKISGNYDYFNDKRLADITWPVMHSHLQDQRDQVIKEFEEKLGANLGVSDIQPVWKAAKEGRGLKLLVEKDFSKPGFLGGDQYHLFLHVPQEPHIVLADAVNEIIEMVLEKDGVIYFTDNGKLRNHQRIALITRY